MQSALGAHLFHSSKETCLGQTLDRWDILGIVKPILKYCSKIVSINLAYWWYETISEEIYNRTINDVQRGSESLSRNTFCVGAAKREHRTI